MPTPANRGASSRHQGSKNSNPTSSNKTTNTGHLKPEEQTPVNLAASCRQKNPQSPNDRSQPNELNKYTIQTSKNPAAACTVPNGRTGRSNPSKSTASTPSEKKNLEERVQPQTSNDDRAQHPRTEQTSESHALHSKNHPSILSNQKEN